MKLSLNGEWKLIYKNQIIKANVPGSFYRDLLDNNLIDDPFYGDNEYKTRDLMDEDITYIKEFEFKEKII